MVYLRDDFIDLVKKTEVKKNDSSRGAWAA